jgi:integrase
MWERRPASAMIAAHPRDRAIVLVLLRTSMRIGELLDTRLTDVDLNEQKIEIMVAQKSRVGRVVYLSEDACAVLGQWLVHRSRKSDYLFHGMGRQRLSYEAVRCRFERYLSRAGLADSCYRSPKLHPIGIRRQAKPNGKWPDVKGGF